MRHRAAILLLLALIGGCSGQGGKAFGIAFPAYSADLDPQAQAAVQAAATFAKAHPLMPLSIAGYAARPDAEDIATLRQQRVAVVRDALVGEGVDQIRIEVLGNGILYPDGVPDLPTDKVNINVGL